MRPKCHLWSGNRKSAHFELKWYCYIRRIHALLVFSPVLCTLFSVDTMSPKSVLLDRKSKTLLGDALRRHLADLISLGKNLRWFDSEFENTWFYRLICEIASSESLWSTIRACRSHKGSTIEIGNILDHWSNITERSDWIESQNIVQSRMQQHQSDRPNL